MAGIGFVLKKLSQQDNLIGWARAHINAAILSTGPWLFTIIAFWSIRWVTEMYISKDESETFMLIIIYNFSFSAIFCGLITQVAARYIADCIFEKNTEPIPSLMVGTIFLALVTQSPVVIWFYFYYLNIPDNLALLAIGNYLIICLIWMTSIYLTAIKNYHAVSNAFIFGMLIAVVLAYFLGMFFSTIGIITGFNLGLGSCLALIIASILSEYPYPFNVSFTIFKYARKYWELILGGLVYNLAIWIDKWIMWFAPESTLSSSGFRVNFYYDNALFVAYLTIIPALGVFIFSMETNFHEKYLIFFNAINRKVNYERIEHNQVEMIETLKKSINNFVAFQGLFTIIIIMISPVFLRMINISMLSLGIFRFAVVGVFFHMLSLFLSIILSYFDCRKSILLIQLVFFVSNASLTYLTMKTDFVYYGMGYMIAAVITFAVSAVITIYRLRILPYDTFISNNTSLPS